MSPKTFSSIIEQIQNFYSIDNSPEITIEINPGDVNDMNISELNSAGINRYSVGVQRFDDEMLSHLNRRHSGKDGMDVLNLLKDKNNGHLDNVSIDLMSNIPHDSLEKWKMDLEKAIEFHPGHISSYSLVLEEDSIFYLNKKYRENKKPLPNEEESAEIFEFTSNRLKSAGYDHYEISSFARNGLESIHNKVYWNPLNSFFGFGMGAVSLLGSKRFTRPSSIKKYFEFVENLEKEEAKLLDILEDGKISIEDYLIGNSRWNKGIDIIEFKDYFGEHSANVLTEAFNSFPISQYFDFKNQRYILNVQKAI